MSANYYLIERNDGTHLGWARWGGEKGVEWVEDPRQADAYADKATAERYEKFYNESDFAGPHIYSVVDRSKIRVWTEIDEHLEACLDPSGRYVDVRHKNTGQRASFFDRRAVEKLLIMFQIDPTDDEHG